MTPAAAVSRRRRCTVAVVSATGAAVACFVRPALAQSGASSGGNGAGTLTPPPAAATTPGSATKPAGAGAPPPAPQQQQRSVTLSLPRPGNYTYWVVGAAGPGAVATLGPDQKSVAIALAAGAREIQVQNGADGTLALLPVAKAKNGAVLIAGPQNFSYVRGLPVTVSGANNRPVRSAVVTLVDAKNRRDQRVLTESDAGKTVFSIVPLGKAVVSATYGAAGAGPKTTQEINVAPAAGGQFVPVALTLPGTVPTLDATATVTAAPGAAAVAGTPIIVQVAPPAAAPKPDEPAGPSWVAGILGLGVLGAGGYFGLRHARARGLTVPGTLRKLGVELPQDAQTNGDLASVLRPAAPAAAPLPPLPSLSDLPEATPSALAGTLGTLATAPARGPAASAAAPAGGGPRLVGVAGSAGGVTVPLGEAEISLGRDPANTVALAQDTSVSRRHARIERRAAAGSANAVDAAAFVLVDNGSSNGTFVNGRRVAGEQELRPGDEIQVGASRFQFEA